MDQRSARPHVPLAVVGLGALFPGSSSVGEFWRDVLAGRDLVGDVPPNYWRVEDYYDPDPRASDKTYCKRGAFLSPVDFDPVEFGIPPNALPTIDTSQLLALLVAKQVLHDVSSIRRGRIHRDRISVILGVTTGLELVGEMASRLQRPVWTKALREHGVPDQDVHEICQRIESHYVEWKETTFPGLLGNVVSGRVASHFDIGGTNCTVDAACASGFSALSMAAYELSLGRTDLAITGGVDTTNDPFLYLCFTKTPAMTPSGDCRPFDEHADGTVLGEGLGMIALRRLEDAERDGDRIYAVIHGIGTSSDGHAGSIYAPRPDGQARALRAAYDDAGYDPDTVELVEAHGTATVAGDATEFAALSSVFDASRRTDRQWCALGSVKSQIGHTKGAAAAAGLIKVVLALQNKVLPPTIKVSQPAARLRIEESPFYLNTESRPWITDGRNPRRASVSSFGFGGTNFHIALEEYQGSRERSKRQRPSCAELIVLGAADRGALTTRCREMVAATVPRALPHIARESQMQAAQLPPVRLAVVASGEKDLIDKLERAVAALESSTEPALLSERGIYFSEQPPDGDVSVLFPGQGSQYLGMAAELLTFFDTAREVWDREAAAPVSGGLPLHQVVFPAPTFTDQARADRARRLTATEWGQPSIAAVSCSFWTLLQAIDLQPASAAGHSLGELTALYAAGVVGELPLLQVARRRGEFMAGAVAGMAEAGTMTAVAAGWRQLQSLIEAWDLDVAMANNNSPRQVVLSGPVSAISEAERRLRAEHISCQRLPVAAAFHSSMVAAAAAPLKEFLAGVRFQRPRMTVYNGSTAMPYPDDPEGIRELLAQGVAQPVRFVDQIEAMYQAGTRTFVEVGPGAVLTGLVKQCLEGRPHVAVSLDHTGAPGLLTLWQALGQLWTAGRRLTLEPLWAEYQLGPDPRTAKTPAMRIAIDGANLARGYPPPPGYVAPVHPAATEMRRTGGGMRDAVTLPTQNELTTDPIPRPEPPPLTNHPAAGDLSAWLVTHEGLQRQLADAHIFYQRSLTESHIAFLKAAETCAAGLNGMMSERGPELPAVPEVPPLAPPAQGLVGRGAPPRSAARSGASRPSGDVVERMRAAPDHPFGAPPSDETRVLSISSPTASLESFEPVGATIAAPPPADLEGLLIALVAESTGYPKEILSLDMNLEGDLGIDSIKRVEIFSKVQERFPQLPTLDLPDLAALQTLAQVLAFVKRAIDEPAAAPMAGPVAADELAPPTPAVRIPRYAPTLRLTPAPGQPLPGLIDAGTIAVIDDGLGVGAALVEKLARLELAARLVDELPGDVRAAIDLRGLRDLADSTAAMTLNKMTFDVARTLAACSGSPRLLVLVQDLGGDLGFSGKSELRAWSGGLAGLVKTVAHECPESSWKAIDLERDGRSGDHLADSIVAELLSGGSEPEVALDTKGNRWTAHMQEAPLPADPTSQPLMAAAATRPVLLVSGGARGITAAALDDLARALKPRLALLGRTPLTEEPLETASADDEAAVKRALADQWRSDGKAASTAAIGEEARRILAVRQVRASIAALGAAGADVRYVAVDVRDSEAVRLAVDEVRAAWGPISGVIHAAGVLADRRLGDKTNEQFDAVFGTKVLGLRALLDATRSDPLQWILFFSSVAARLGNAGQADYGMANEVLNKVAAFEAKQRPGCTVRSLCWGPWEFGMVTPSLRRLFEQAGVPLICAADGARHLLAEMCTANGSSEVVVGDWPQLATARTLSRVPSVENRFVVHADRDSDAVVSGHRVDVV